MIINDIEVYILEKNLSSPMTISRGGFMKRQHLIVELTSESGIKGYGEAIGNIQLIKIIIKIIIAFKVLSIKNFKKHFFHKNGYCYISSILSANYIVNKQTKSNEDLHISYHSKSH